MSDYVKLFCDYVFNHLSNKKNLYALQKMIDEKDIEIRNLKINCAKKEKKIQELYDELTKLHEEFCDCEKDLKHHVLAVKRLIMRLEEEMEKHISIEKGLKDKINDLENFLNKLF